ncbi:hypothetical protein PENSPDRAFT_757010, partial [Peniophora sp. CONT]
MSTSLAQTEAHLQRYGLTRVTNGEHLDAWKTFWGAEIQLQEQPVWNQWHNALNTDSHNSPLVDLAMAVNVFSSSDNTALPSCTFLRTPWKSSLPRTGGRIMVTEDYERLDSECLKYSIMARCSDVVIAGQSGSGRTYLSHFILACSLSRRQSMIFFTGTRILVFSPLGVFSGESLDLNFVTYGYFQDTIGARPLALVDVADDSDYSGPVESMFFSIRVYPPSSRRYEQWIDRYGPAMLVLDALPAPLVVSAATLQLHIEATRACLQQLLVCLRIAGLNLRLVLSLDASVLRVSLRDHISRLSADLLSQLAQQARFSPYPVETARMEENGSALFSLRRDMTTYEACLPVIASRHIVGEIGEIHGYAGLSALRSMEVVRHSPDGFLDTNIWIFEHLCHVMLSSGSPEHLPRLRLSRCFPLGAYKSKGALKMAHLCAPRSRRAFDLRSPSSFDTAGYHYIETLADGTVHAILHARRDNVSSQPDHLAQLDPAVSAQQRQKLRPRVHVAEAVHDRPSKRRKTLADRRIIIFMQVVCGICPQVTDDGLRRLENTMQSSPDSEYCFVFVTEKDTAPDLSSVSLSWLNRFKWYHLFANVDSDIDDGSDSSSTHDSS